MKRSEINELVRSAAACFGAHGWALPPEPRWDVTDFGLGDVSRWGLVLVNLAEEPEYCEKLMYAKRGMLTLAHCHKKKKEDIICRWGALDVRAWPELPGKCEGQPLLLQVNGRPRSTVGGETISLNAGERVTLEPGIYHEFEPGSEEVIIGEVSTANDDLHDNFFVDSGVGRFPQIQEDEPAIVSLVSDR